MPIGIIAGHDCGGARHMPNVMPAAERYYFTGSYRQAILSLIGFFVVGTGLLLFTNTARAIHAAGNFLPDEAASES